MKKLIILLFLGCTSLVVLAQVDTMTFSSGFEPGFGFSGLIPTSGILYPAAPNVNSIQTISKSTCWDIISFQSDCFAPSCLNPSNGEWKVWNNLGDEQLFVIGGGPNTVTLNWQDIRWVKFQLQNHGTLGPNQTWELDNLIYNLPANAPAAAAQPVVMAPGSGCVGSTWTFSNTGALNDATEWQVRSDSCNGSIVATTSDLWTVSPGLTTTYYITGVKTDVLSCVADGPCDSVTVVVDKFGSTDPTNVLVSPDTMLSCNVGPVQLIATGGVVGSGSQVHWYDQLANPIGTGDTLVVSPTTTSYYLYRRIGTCNTTQYKTVIAFVVDDTEAPTISCPPDVVFDQFYMPGSACSPIPSPGLASASTSDNCAGGIYPILSGDVLFQIPPGNTQVTWTSTDQAGNSSSCVQNVFLNCIECSDPINPSSAVTTTTATLDWTSISELAPWELEVVPAGTTPNGSGVMTASKPYTVSGLTPFTDYDFYVRVSCGPGMGNWAGPFSFTTDIGYQLKPKVILQGAYDTSTGLMNDDLRANGLIPIVQPFTDLGFTLYGPLPDTVAPDVFTVTGPDAIVDWVLLEFRSWNDITNIYLTRCALLQRDGDVVELDGVSPITFYGVSLFTPFMSIRHRNHLGFVTSATLTLPAVVTTLDFTDGSIPTYGVDGFKVENGVHMMWAGDVSGDGLIKYVGADNDRDPILVEIGGSVPTASTTGYLTTDVNMDGVVKYVGASNDRDPLLVNIGGSVPTATRSEQLP